MLPAIVPLVQVGISFLSAYGAFNYIQNNYLVYEGVCTNTWGLSKNLSMNIFGQSSAIFQLSEFMSTNHDYGAHVLLLCGGPGTGKTYSASIVENCYTPRDRIVGIVPSLHPLNNETLKVTLRKIRWITKGFGLIIIDGHNLKDENLIQFVSEINSYCLKNKLVAKMIIIQNSITIHSTSSNPISAESFKTSQDFELYINKIAKEAELYFIENGIDCTVATFGPILSSTVKQCVEASFVRLKIKHNPQNVQEIVNIICGEHKDFAPSGCKDVDSYVAMSHKK